MQKMNGKTMRALALSVLALAAVGGTLAWAASEGCEPARWKGMLAMGPGMGGHGPMMGRGRRGQGMGQGGPMMGRGNFIRHREVMMKGIPAPYAGRTNPLAPTKETMAAGKALFADNCASCHGASGRGDGEAGKELNPPPADITRILGRRLDRDDFFFWTISEGGEKLKTDMPAFKDVLSEKERWQIITWLRHGLGR